MIAGWKSAYKTDSKLQARSTPYRASICYVPTASHTLLTWMSSLSKHSRHCYQLASVQPSPLNPFFIFPTLKVLKIWYPPTQMFHFYLFSYTVKSMASKPPWIVDTESKDFRLYNCEQEDNVNSKILKEVIFNLKFNYSSNISIKWENWVNIFFLSHTLS